MFSHDLAAPPSGSVAWSVLCFSGTGHITAHCARLVTHYFCKDGLKHMLKAEEARDTRQGCPVPQTAIAVIHGVNFIAACRLNSNVCNPAAPASCVPWSAKRLIPRLRFRQPLCMSVDISRCVRRCISAEPSSAAVPVTPGPFSCIIDAVAAASWLDLALRNGTRTSRC